MKNNQKRENVVAVRERERERERELYSRKISFCFGTKKYIKGIKTETLCIKIPNVCLFLCI